MCGENACSRRPWPFFSDATPAQCRARQLWVSFRDEFGIDAGGLRRDFFASTAEALAASGLFAPASEDNATLLPTPAKPGQRPTEECRRRYAAVGRFLGTALWHREPLPVDFSPALYQMLLGLPVTARDVRALDEVVFRNRVQPLLVEGGVAAMEAELNEELYFTYEGLPLKAAGDTERVTEASRAEYIHLLCEDYLTRGRKPQIAALLEGFWEVVPLEALGVACFDAGDLEFLLAGQPELDVGAWRAHTVVAGQVHDQLAWFWECLDILNYEGRARVLAFATGSARLPPRGFAGLEPRFTLAWDPDPSHLPVAHTCVNQLVLPMAASRGALGEALRLAVAFGMGFGEV